jgi:DNA processing protein
LTASQRSSHLFLSLLQARVGASLVSRLGGLPPEDLLEMASVELASRVRITERAAREFERLRAAFDPDAIYTDLARRNLCVLTLADAGYPERLRVIPDPPPALFVSGKVPDVPAVALVGSRKASGTGLECARALGGALGERGVCVVSGLALGVDAAAHEGALEAGGPTVGVLGCGIDVVLLRVSRSVFCELRLWGILGNSLPASNALATPKITHLGDVPCASVCYGGGLVRERIRPSRDSLPIDT